MSAALLLLTAVLVRPAAADPIRLDAAGAVARAVEASNVTAAAAQRASAGLAAVVAADAARYPTVVASAGVAQRSSVPEFSLPLSLPGQPPLVLLPDITTTYAAGVRVQELLWAGGGVDGLRQAARDDADVVAAARLQSIAEVRLAAEAAYWEVVRALANVEVARSQETRARRLLTDTQSLLDAGMAVEADRLAARERVASAHVQMIATETAAANAFSGLRSLIQATDDAPIELADTTGGPLPQRPPAVEALLAQSLSGRPELKALDAQIAAARARGAVAASPARPALVATGQWDYQRPNGRYFPQADTFKSSWSIGLGANWTLFDGGKSKADVAANQASRSALELDRRELERRIRLEVTTRRRELESALAAVKAADAARAAATEREKASNERFAAGLAAMTEILDAQAQLAAAEQQQINARAASWLAQAVLNRALGQ